MLSVRDTGVGFPAEYADQREYRAKVVSPLRTGTARWGRWTEGRRARMSIECIDAEMITRDITNCSSSRAMATVGADHDAELWRLSDAPGSLENQPIALNKRAKVTPNSRLAKRIDPAHMEAMWREAAKRIQERSATQV